MERDTSRQQTGSTSREQSRTSQSSTTAGQSNQTPGQSTSQATGSSASGRTAATAPDQSDRERGIQTDRERGGSSGMVRQPAGSPAYGSRYGSIANPTSMLRRMAEDMDRLFATFGLDTAGLGASPFRSTGLDRDLWQGGSALSQAAWSPQVEVLRRGDQLVVRADLPGLEKDDVNVEIDDGVLTISGERSEQREENRDDFYRSERSYGQFYRAIPLPDGVDTEAVEASFKDGVLEVTLPAPKDQDRQAKRVQIR
jgi:HSP20 family protein